MTLKRFAGLFLKSAAAILGLMILTIFMVNYYVSYSSRNFIYHDIKEIPHNRVGIVLGTSKYTIGKRINLYYKYRVDAAVALYQAGKVDFILISGDNSTKHYDEPTTFKKDLVERGIPAAEKIFLDYAGFRTLDSVIRAKEVFQLESFTIISQQFHNERAISIARHHDINAIAFSAQDVHREYAVKVMIREYFARVKMVIDLLSGQSPRFLGEKEVIGP